VKRPLIAKPSCSSAASPRTISAPGSPVASASVATLDGPRHSRWPRSRVAVAASSSRRPPRAATGRLGPWLLAAGGTFGGLLFRPAGAHPQWGVAAGLVLQLLGLALAVIALVVLGRSFGFVAADRGLVTRGPYVVIRHPVYAAYVVIQVGYLIQSISVRNVAVLVFVTGCNIGRAAAEERVLAASADYEAYRERVRWRLVPGLWVAAGPGAFRTPLPPV